MTALMKKTSTLDHTPQEVVEALRALNGSIAQELIPLLKKADLETYKHFLLTMYHYTKNSEEQLLHARDFCNDSKLKDYFYDMSREERGHYLLAQRDYEEFGGDVAASQEPIYIKNFADFWYSLGKRNQNEFVGAVFIFENVASLVAKDVIDMMQRLELTKKQSRWLRVHLEADVGHGDEAMKICLEFADNDPDAMIEAGKLAAIQWMSVFRHAFKGN